jgi:dynein light chain Tctex-type 1
MIAESSDTSMKDEIRKICEEAIMNTLGDQKYDKTSVGDWIKNMTYEVTNTIRGQNYQSYKFVCDCRIIHKAKTRLHFSSTCLWNPNSDITLSVKWENETMHCFICIYALR